jgi:hypothetical protein
VAGSDYAVFPIDVDRLPDGAGPLRFRVVRTVAGGATEEWSDLVPHGAPAPAHPALVVPYGVPAAPGAAAAPRAAHHHGGVGGGVPDVAAAVSPSRAGGGSVAGSAGVVGVVATLVGVGATLLGRRQRRRLSAVRDPRQRP